MGWGSRDPPPPVGRGPPRPGSAPSAFPAKGGTGKYHRRRCSPLRQTLQQQPPPWPQQMRPRPGASSLCAWACSLFSENAALCPRRVVSLFFPPTALKQPQDSAELQPAGSPRLCSSLRYALVFAGCCCSHWQPLAAHQRVSSWSESNSNTEQKRRRAGRGGGPSASSGWFKKAAIPFRTFEPSLFQNDCLGTAG